MDIYNIDKNIEDIVEYINTQYPYQKIAFFVDDNIENIDLIRKIQKQLNNIIIENESLTEDVTFCVICGNYKFQQDSLIEVTYNNINYAYIVTDLSQCSFLSPYIQDENLIEIYMPKVTFFIKSSIKKQNFSSNCAVFSYIQSKRLSVFELEFYSRIFNKNYILDFKNKLTAICDAFYGIMESKIKNCNSANIKVLDLVIRYLKLQEKNPILYKEDSIFNFSNNLTNNLFTNFYDNFYIASIFATNLYEKYFALSFKNNYCFDFSKQIEYSSNNFIDTINEYMLSEVKDDLNYKIIVNQNYFKSELLDIKTKYFLKKYDFLCFFDDFGYDLVKKLEKCNFKSIIKKVANNAEFGLFKQIRNYGLLDF